MNRNDKAGITTLTLLDGVAGCDEIDLPTGRLVRVEGDAASLFVVEAGDGCGGCARFDAARGRALVFSTSQWISMAMLLAILLYHYKNRECRSF